MTKEGIISLLADSFVLALHLSYLVKKKKKTEESQWVVLLR